MKAYSIDLRERILDAVDSGRYSQAEVAERFEVSLSFVEQLLRRRRVTGSIAPTVYTPGPKRVLEPYRAWIRAAVAARPDSTLAELCDRLGEEHAVRAHPSMMWRELARLRLPLKKSRSTTASGTRRG
jgi:transposase